MRISPRTHLVFCILRQPVQTRYAQLELARLGEFAETCSQGDEVRASDGGG